MFAILGEITFEVSGSPAAIRSRQNYDYAEQRVVEDKPRLQWIADALERLEVEMLLHASLSDPAAQLALLRASASAHRPLPLIFGNGVFRGFFVIESIEVRSRQLSAAGAPIVITAAVGLKEWAAGSEVNGALTAAFTPLGLAAAPGAAAGPVTAAAPLPGVSALRSVTPQPAAASPNQRLDDVSAAAIVRSPAQ
ncbi:MAG: phage tail protein [Candidatus Binataceae bacterium]